MRRIQIVLAVLLFSAVLAHAQDGAAPTRYGIQIGLGSEQHLSGHTPSSGTKLAILAGQVITRIDHTKVSQEERFELVNEVSVIESLHPARRFIIGDSEILRYTFPWNWHWRLFGDVGPGLASSALHSPDIPQLSGWLQYELQGGFGIKRKSSHGRNDVLEYRLTHFSNHGTMLPNSGLNLHTFIVGMNF